MYPYKWDDVKHLWWWVVTSVFVSPLIVFPLFVSRKGIGMGCQADGAALVQLVNQSGYFHMARCSSQFFRSTQLYFGVWPASSWIEVCIFFGAFFCSQASVAFLQPSLRNRLRKIARWYIYIYYIIFYIIYYILYIKCYILNILYYLLYIIYYILHIKLCIL